MENYKIAVLLTCFNRKQKTLDFLESLFRQPLVHQLKMDIYILDDNSTDGTREAVLAKYPEINMLKGTGSYFWAGGMRAAWKHALEKNKYDLFLLFNDDVILYKDAVQRLLDNYESRGKKGTLLVGSTFSPKTNNISYGGSVLKNIKLPAYSLIKPDDVKFLTCHLGNFNVVLIDAFTISVNGVFSEAFVHGLADFDYTLSAFKKGIDVLIAPGYYGTCENDHGVNWISQSKTFKQRIAYMYSPKGLAYKEYLIYMKKHFPVYWPMAFSKLWMKTLFPVLWDRFKK